MLQGGALGPAALIDTLCLLGPLQYLKGRHRDACPGKDKRTVETGCFIVRLRHAPDFLSQRLVFFVWSPFVPSVQFWSLNATH